MALSKAQKSDILEVLKEKIRNAKSIGFTSNNGLTVSDASELRKKVAEANGEYMLAKKTLIRIAFKEVLGAEIDESLLNGQIGMVLSYEDAIEGLSACNSVLKSFKEKMVWDSGYFDGEVKNSGEISEIAGLPTRTELLSRLVGSMQSPLSSLARFMDAAAKEIEAQGKETLSQVEKKEEKEAQEA